MVYLVTYISAVCGRARKPVGLGQRPARVGVKILDMCHVSATIIRRSQMH
jgi:hypothetical protein